MILYHKKVSGLLKKFVRVQVRYVPRTKNSRADALDKLATASQEDLDRRVSVKHLMEPSIDVNSDEVLPVMATPSWMDPIWDYLLNRTLPSDPKEASKLRARSARFSLLRGTLYKRGFSAPLLKCIGKEYVDYVLREVREGICSNHIRARALAGKTLRQGYYWPTMLKDCNAPFRTDPIGGSKPDPRCSITTQSLYQNHLSKMRGSDFNLGKAHKHLQI